MFKLEGANYHLHTYYSDGEYSPAYVVSKFAGLGCTELAITDHDGVAGIPEAAAKAEELGITLRTGIELSTRTADDDIGLHILGYDIDIENKMLLNKVEEVRRWRQERNSRLIEELCNMGMHVSLDDLQVREGQDYIGKPIFARVLFEKGYIKNYYDAFGDKVFGSDRLKAVKKKSITTEEGISMILNAGGIPVLAHPGQIKSLGTRNTDMFYANFEKLLDRLVQSGLQGVECIYDNVNEKKRHSDGEKKRFKEIAEARGLYVTRGTDFHNER